MSKIKQTALSFADIEEVEVKIEKEDFMNKVICGDALEVLKRMSGWSVDLVVTSPPYWGLRDYGEETLMIWGGDKNCEHEWGVDILNPKRDSRTREDLIRQGATVGNTIRKELFDAKTMGSFCVKCDAWKGQLGLEPYPQIYIDHIVAISKEIKRVLKPSGSLWLNLGDTYFGGGRDQDFKRSPKQLSNRGSLGYATLPSYKSDGSNWLKSKQLLGIPERIMIALQNEGLLLRNKIIWRKPNAMPTSVKDRLKNAYEVIYHFVRGDARSDYYIIGNEPNKEKQLDKYKLWQELRKWWRENGGGVKHLNEIPSRLIKASTNLDYYYDLDAIREPYSIVSFERILQPTIMQQKGGEKQIQLRGEKKSAGDHGSRSADIVKGMAKKVLESWGASEGIYEGEAVKNYEVAKAQNPSDVKRRIIKGALRDGFKGKNPADVWVIPTQPFKGAHFATFPIVLIERIVKVSCPHNGVVLDPFCGSGTTLYVARKLGRRFIGVDISSKYVEMSKRRIRGGKK